MPTTTYTAVEEFAVRLAGQPATVLDGFGLAGALPVLTGYLALRDRAEAARDAACDALYDAVPALAGTPAKPLAVALRRAVHRDDLATAAGLLDRLTLPPVTTRLVQDWSELARRGARLRAELDQLAEAGTRAETARMRAACADPEFRRGVAHASPSVRQALDAWLAGPADAAPTRKLSGALTRYLTRAAAKTSPYSTFTSCGLGRLGEGGPAWAGTDDGQRLEVAEVNLWTLAAVAGLLLDRPANRDGLPVRINPSLRADGDELIAVGRGPRQESVIRLPLNAAVRRCLDLLREQPLTLGELREKLAADGDPARVRAFLGQLLDCGVLQTVSPVTDQHPDHLAALTAWAGRCPEAGEPVRQALAGLAESVAGYGTGGTDQGARRARVYRELGALAESLGRSRVPVPRTDAFFHNVVAPRPLVRADREHWRPVLDELDVLRRFLALFDMGLAARLAVGCYVAARYPAGRTVPFVVLCQDLFAHAADQAAGRPHELAAHAVELLADPNPVGLAGSPAPELRELERARQRVLAALAELPEGDDGVVRLDTGWLAARIAEFPAFVRAPRSVSVYGQPGSLDGSPHLVVNMLATGWQRAAGRVRRQLADAGHQAPGYEPAVPAGGPVPVEVRAAFGHSGNLRHRATSYAIDYPAAVCDLAAAEQIPLADLELSHDGPVGSVRLRSASRRFDVLPVHLGLMAPTLLPPVMRLLLAFGESAVLTLTKQNPLAAPTPENEQPHGVRLPRFALPHVTVQRACWLFGGEDVPRAAAGDTPAEHLVRMARWRAGHGVPQRCFARVLPRSMDTDRANPMQKSRKPFYLDFTSPLLLDSFDRALGAPDDLVVLEEVWPVPPDDPGARVTEIVLELTAPGSTP